MNLAAFPAIATAIIALTCGDTSARAVRKAKETTATAAAPIWEKVPLLTPEAVKLGIRPGGEGGQWPRGAPVVSEADPRLLLFPIDVGGLYRSRDGGRTWESCAVGWNARGANAFAFDPKNSNRILGIGGNSMDWDKSWGPNTPHGVYLSTDGASSWRHVLGLRDGLAGALAFDATSFDAAKKLCATAFALSAKEGLFRTDDGGSTWRRAPLPFPPEADDSTGKIAAPAASRPSGMGVSMLEIDPRNGMVYLAGESGLFRSDGRGGAWARLLDEPLFGFDLLPDGTLFVSGMEKVKHSRDGGKTFFALPCAGLEAPAGKPVKGIRVSPASPRRMLSWVEGDDWRWVRYHSGDGGATWAPIQFDHTGAALPHNVRQGYFTWHPTDANVAWGIGGDWATKSTDGGRTFRWSNNGNNGIMVGGLFGFSAHDPTTVFLAFQDYNGALTMDGGKTWRYRSVSGKGWGGYCYGGFAVDRVVMWAGDADSWNGPRRLRLSRDSGETWTTPVGPDGKPIVFAGPDVSACDPANPKILFASNYRSADRGATWAPMAGCDGVFTSNPKTRALYGRKGTAIVRSTDGGETWRTVEEPDDGFTDLAVDHERAILYVASADRLKRFAAGRWTTLETPKDQYGNSRVTTVAVDPVDPAVIYVGGPRNVYTSHATVSRSTDGGRTWRNLTVTEPLGKGIQDGPHEVAAIRVHPVTREAWVNGQCFGMWRIAPPAPDEAGRSAEEASAPKAIQPPFAADLL